MKSTGNDRIWWQVFKWQAFGLAFAGAAAPVLWVIRHGGEAEIGILPAVSLGSIYWTIVGGLFLVPISASALFIWSLTARRVLILESSVQTMTLGLVVLSAFIVVVAAGVSNWQSLVHPAFEPFFPAAWNTVREIWPPVAVGVLLPRAVVPSLRRGAFSPSSGGGNVAPTAARN